MTPAAASPRISARGVEARAVDVAVAATVAHGDARRRAAAQQGRAQPVRERPLVDPVPALQRARLGEERAEAAVRQAVREEVQVVEADERAERDVGVDRPADRHREHARGAQLLQGRDVRPMRDMVGEPRMPGPVAGDVQHLDAGPGPTRDQRLAPRRVHRLRSGALEPGQRVGAGAGQDPDRHRGGTLPVEARTTSSGADGVYSGSASPAMHASSARAAASPNSA